LFSGKGSHHYWPSLWWCLAAICPRRCTTELGRSRPWSYGKPMARSIPNTLPWNWASGFPR